MKHRFCLTFLIFFSCALFCAGQIRSQHLLTKENFANSETLSKDLSTIQIEKWREDLRVLATELPKRHRNAFFSMTPEQFEKAVKDLDRQIPSLTDAQIGLELARIVAMVNDGHTALWLPFQPAAKFRALPIRLYLFKEGLFVQSAAPEYAGIVGGKVLKIGHATTEKALEKVGEYVSKENHFGLKSSVPMYLIAPEILQAQGFIKDAEKVDLLIEKDGKQFTTELKPAGLFTEIVSPVGRKNWLNANSNSKNPMPLRLKNEGNEFWFEYAPDTKILYIQLNQLANKADETIEKFFGRVGEALNKNDVDKLVLDIRNNGGGNNGLVPHVIRTVVKFDKIDQNGKFFVIIGRQTFSAAQNLTNELEKYTKAVFVGEPTGSRVNMYGDARPLILPNSQFRVNISTLWWQNMAELDRRQWTAPQIAAEPTFADFAANIDTPMQAILDYKPQKSLREIAMGLFQANDLKSFRARAIEYKNNPINKFQSVEADINSFGYRLMQMQKMDEAIEMFKLNTELYPDSPNVYDSLGEALANAGRREEAIKAYEKALQIAPNYPSAIEALSKLKGK